MVTIVLVSVACSLAAIGLLGCFVWWLVGKYGYYYDGNASLGE